MTDATEVLEDVLRELVRIGARPYGSAANDAALALVADRLERLGLSVVEESLTAPHPQEPTSASLHIDGEPVACVPFLDAISGYRSGRAERAGSILVWGMHESPFWIVESPDGLGAVTVSSFPTPVQQHIPTVLAGLPAVIVDGAELRGRLDVPGALVELEVTTPLRRRPGRSLRAFWGTDPMESPSSPQPLVVAHIDTVPGTPGVYDNAAGVAAAVSIAAVEPEAPFQILISNAEEEGLLGARAFAQRLADRSWAIVSHVVVLDGGGRGTTVEAWFSDRSCERLLSPYFNRVSDAQGYTATSYQPAPPDGDHAAFSLLGIPAVMYTVNDLEILHTPNDVDAVSKHRASALLAALARASLAAISHTQ